MGGAPGEYFGRTERQEQERVPEEEAGYTTGNLHQLHSIQLSFTTSSVHCKNLSLLYTVLLFNGGLWPAQDRNHGGGGKGRKYELSARSLQIICMGRRNIWEVADSTVMRKWKRLFMNGCECESPISAATEFLNYGFGHQYYYSSIRARWSVAVTCLIGGMAHG